MMSLTRLPEGCIWGSGSLSICVSAEPQNSPLPATSMMHSRSFYFEICTTLCRPQLLKKFFQKMSLCNITSHISFILLFSVYSQERWPLFLHTWLRQSPGKEAAVWMRQLANYLICHEMLTSPKTKQHCSRRYRLPQSWFLPQPTRCVSFPKCEGKVLIIEVLYAHAGLHFLCSIFWQSSRYPKIKEIYVQHMFLVKVDLYSCFLIAPLLWVLAKYL